MPAVDLSRVELTTRAPVSCATQRTCACCNEQGRCERDLMDRHDDRLWKDYCPNATTLDALTGLKDRCRASQA